jgi:hypothetical protein
LVEHSAWWFLLAKFVAGIGRLWVGINRGIKSSSVGIGEMIRVVFIVAGGVGGDDWTSLV